MRDALGIDDGVGVGELLGEIVMIGDDNATALVAGHLNEFVLFDTGVAGDEELHAVVEHVLKRFFGDAVGFFATDGDVMNDIGVEVLEGGDEESGGGLTVYVEVAPDADALLFFKGVENDGEGEI